MNWAGWITAGIAFISLVVILLKDMIKSSNREVSMEKDISAMNDRFKGVESDIKEIKERFDKLSDEFIDMLKAKKD